LKTFVSFDGAIIAYRDEGEGAPVILLHGYGVDDLGQFGSFERILPILQARQPLFIETFGGAPPLPDPPDEGRPGIIPPLLAANARVILPDLRGFGASSKSREVSSSCRFHQRFVRRDLSAPGQYPGCARL
jgi:pimeloyl-ACP methyl ester carboxylesterase